MIMIVEENHKIVMCLLEIISLKDYTPETWRAASKKRRLHRRLNKAFLTIEDRPGNTLEEEEPTEFESVSNDDEYEQTRELDGTDQLGLADGCARSDGLVKFFILVNSYPGGCVYSFRNILSGQLRGRKVMMMASQTRMI